MSAARERACALLLAGAGACLITVVIAFAFGAPRVALGCSIIGLLMGLGIFIVANWPKR